MTETVNTEKVVRSIFRQHARRLAKALLTPECHAGIEQQIQQQLRLLLFIKHEASLKKRSPGYKQFCKRMLAEAATAELGPLASLGEADLDALEKMLGAVIAGMKNTPRPLEQLDPASFVSFQKKLIVRPKKRGPKYDANYDKAFLRSVKGEETSSIARDLEPEAYAADPVNTIQRYANAFERRRELLSRKASR